MQVRPSLPTRWGGFGVVFAQHVHSSCVCGVALAFGPHAPWAQVQDVYQEAGRVLKSSRVDLNLSVESVAQVLDDLADEVRVY